MALNAAQIISVVMIIVTLTYVTISLVLMARHKETP